MKYLLVIIALAACNSQYEIEPNMNHIRDGINRAVTVTSYDLAAEADCSGVILSTSYVLTAAHCIHFGAKVNNSFAYVLKRNNSTDLVLLYTYTPAFSSLVINTQPKLLEKIYTISEPTGIRVVSLGRIIGAGNGHIHTNTVIGHGASGGAVYDRYGRLLGIIDRMRMDHQAIVFGAAIDGVTIKRFLDEY